MKPWQFQCDEAFLSVFSLPLKWTRYYTTALTYFLVTHFQHLPLSSLSEDMMHNMNNVLQPSDSSENEQHMSHMDQGNEIDGELNISSLHLSPDKRNMKTPPKLVFVKKFLLNFCFNETKLLKLIDGNVLIAKSILARRCWPLFRDQEFELKYFAACWKQKSFSFPDYLYKKL